MTSETPNCDFKHVRDPWRVLAKEGHRHDIGFGAGALGERGSRRTGCGKAPGQAAQQRHECASCGCDARHGSTAAGKRAAVADADQVLWRLSMRLRR